MARNAPGKHYRKGISLIEVVKRFSDEAEAERWFIETRWADGVVCPFCESPDKVKERPTRKPQPYHCGSCRKYFSVKTKTMMHGSKLPLSSWAIAYFLISTNLKGVSSMKLHRDLNVTQKTAWFMAMRIRETLKDAHPELFAGPVEADETYIGGKEGNKHEAKKLKKGRGAVGKTPVAGVIDRPTNQIKTQVVEKTDGKTLKGFVHNNTESGAQVYTDEARAYEGLNRPHEAVAHSANEYVRGMAHTNGMESHWALFKRGIDGIYHHVSVKHLGRYTAEFSGRHNRRPLDTEEQMAIMARNGVGRQLRYEDLIGPKETRLQGL